MVLRKTGGLFGLAVRLMQIHSSCKLNFAKVLELLGLWFQIRDDYANLKSDKYIAQKTFADDLTEGKFSFPIIHSIRATPRSRELANILRQRTSDLELKKFAIECIEKSGSFAYTRKYLRDLETELLAEIAALGGNDALTTMVDGLRGLYQESTPE